MEDYADDIRLAWIRQVTETISEDDTPYLDRKRKEAIEWLRTQSKRGYLLDPQVPRKA